MRIRCPKCTSVNEHPDDLGWRKTECPICSHWFVTSKRLVVGTDAPVASDKDNPNAPTSTQSPTGRGVSRAVAMVVAMVALLGAGLLARAWLVARYEFQKLQSEVADLSAVALPASDDGSSSDDASAAGTDGAGNVVSLKEKLEADHMLATLQDAVIEKMRAEAEELEARIRILETKVERGENAFGREKKAHGKTKQKLAAAQKEVNALRRELNAGLREIRMIEMKLRRGQ